MAILKRITRPSTTASTLADEYNQIHGCLATRAARALEKNQHPPLHRDQVPSARWLKAFAKTGAGRSRALRRAALFASEWMLLRAKRREWFVREKARAREAADPVMKALIEDYHAGPERTALCLSGGGIRSASFALGALQWLAKNQYLEQFQYLSTVSGGGYIGAWLSGWIAKEKEGYSTVRKGLSWTAGDLNEPSEIRHLRENSRYLTQKAGLATGDTWATVAIALRNLVLNWLIIVPLLSMAVLWFQFIVIAFADNGPFGHAIPTTSVMLAAASYATFSVASVANRPQWAVYDMGRTGFTWLCLLPMLVAALSWSTIVARTSDPSLYETRTYGGLLQWYLGALVSLNVAVWFTAMALRALRRRSQPIMSVGAGNRRPLTVDEARDTFGRTPAPGEMVLAFDAVLSIGSDGDVSAEAYIDDRQAVAEIHFKDTVIPVAFAAGQVRRTILVPLTTARIEAPPVGPTDVKVVLRNVVGAHVGIKLDPGVYVRDLLGYAAAAVGTASGLSGLHAVYASMAPCSHTWALVLACVGVPGFLLAHMTGGLAYLAITSRAPKSEETREWLGRSSGLLLQSAVAWLVLSCVVLLLPEAFASIPTMDLKAGIGVLGLIGATSGTVTAFIGGGAATPALMGRSVAAWRSKAVLPLASMLFTASLIALIALSLDAAALKGSLLASLRGVAGVTTVFDAFRPLAFTLGVLLVILVTANLTVNVNRFSLHAMYRNRLVRAFLGASIDGADEGRTNRFTGFNEAANLEMQRLWDRNRRNPTGDGWRPFHVVNVTLNVLGGRGLSLQERKALPFTITPLWCGSAALDAYRRASEYGGGDKTISLGTAMAISGAAVSPNMGYHSSPLVTLILGLCNVRLGCWYGNPADPSTFQQEGPSLAARPLVDELFGFTGPHRSYVYLTDGGHFDNLGLYEMVRRRCHLIVVSDAGHDPECRFSDLSHTIARIGVDFGIPITFEHLTALRGRNADRTTPDGGGDGFAVGLIDYRTADGLQAKQGILLYIKPCFRGDESVPVLGYAASHVDFPHESTVDQWFTELQFESYRMLGHANMQRAITSAGLAPESPRTLTRLFEGLKAAAYPKP